MNGSEMNESDFYYKNPEDVAEEESEPLLEDDMDGVDAEALEDDGSASSSTGGMESGPVGGAGGGALVAECSSESRLTNLRSLLSSACLSVCLSPHPSGVVHSSTVRL